MDFQKRQPINEKGACRSCGKEPHACRCPKFAEPGETGKGQHNFQAGNFQAGNFQAGNRLVADDTTIGAQQMQSPLGHAPEMTRSLSQQRSTMPSNMVPHQPDKVGRIINGRYELLQELGAGGMGTVYRAKHLALNKMVAVKLLRSDLSQQEEFFLRLDREAKTASMLNHPNLVTVYDSGTSETGELFIVMEFVQGHSLADKLEQGRLPAPQAVRLFRQICDGLLHAHSMGVVHRDLKPANIILTKDAEGKELAKVVDFGIAKSELASRGQALTKTGDVFGSPLYMSPEQCQGARTDQRSDIYSLGCVMYECLSGKPPFQGNSSFATMVMHTEAPPQPFARELKILPRMQAVVLKCLEKKPEERYQSMAELRTALQLLQTKEAVGESFARDHHASGSKFRVVLIGGIVCGALVLLCLNPVVYSNITSRLTKADSRQTPTNAASTDQPQAISETVKDISKSNPDKDVPSKASPSDGVKTSDEKKDSTGQSDLIKVEPMRIKKIAQLLPLPESADEMTPEMLVKAGETFMDAAKHQQKTNPAQATRSVEKAYRFLAEAIKRDPSYLYAYDTRCLWDWDLHLYELDVEHTKEFLRLKNNGPGTSGLYVALSHMLLQLNRNAEALEAANNAFAVGDPEEKLTALAQRGYINRGLHHYKEAIDDLKRVASPLQLNSMPLLADSYIQTKQYEAAVAVIDKFMRTKPKDLPPDQVAYAISMRAEAEKQLGRYDLAIADDERVMKLGGERFSGWKYDIEMLKKLQQKKLLKDVTEQ